MSDIDPVEFGKVVASIENIERRLDAIEPQIADMIAMKNKGKGYVAALITFSGISGAAFAEGVRRIFGGH